MVETPTPPLYVFRLSPVIFVGPSVCLLLIVSAVLWFNFSDMSSFYQVMRNLLGAGIYDAFVRSYGQVAYYGRLLSVVLLLINTVFFLLAYIRYATTELRIFPQTVQWRFGFIQRDLHTATLREGTGITLTQTVLGRLLNFGSVSVNTRGVDEINAVMIGNAPGAYRTLLNILHPPR